MTVLMRENDGLDPTRAAFQRGGQAVGSVVENAVAFGKPATVEQLVSG